MIVDKFTKEVDIKIITRKNEMIQHLQEYVMRSEEMGFKIETIQTNLAGEFATGKKFISWLQEKGISHEMSAPYLQYQNGIVERHIQTIEDHVTMILITSGLLNGFWGKAMLYVVKTWNMTANDHTKW